MSDCWCFKFGNFNNIKVFMCRELAAYIPLFIVFILMNDDFIYLK